MVDANSNKRPKLARILRVLIGVLIMVVCYRLIADSVAAGVSRLFSTVAIVQSSLEPAEKAVSLSPSDPEAHYTLALTLSNHQRLDEALAEMQLVTRLRPHYYYVWLDLGLTLDRLGKPEAAAAFSESIRLAPSFSQPRWQFGNFLYRQEKFEDAFVELRRGATSNPRLVGPLLDLAWEASNHDARLMEGLVQPQSRRMHFEMARLLARQGAAAEAARQIREAGNPDDDGERTLLNQTISALLAGDQFLAAYSAWAATHLRASEGASAPEGHLLNGNFLEPVKQEESGFGWQLPTLPSLAASIDPSGPSPGTQSLRLEFSGDPPLGSQFLSQIVLVQPKTHYLLSFKARTEKLVSGGPPVVLIAIADSKLRKTLAQSTPLSVGTNGWSDYSIDFTAEENVSAVIVGLQRLPCNETHCPIFGKLWLGSISLSKV